MPIFRVEHNTNYSVISNRHLRDRRLSLKAKGLLTYMLSMPNDWDFSLAGLTSNLKEGTESIRNTLAELKENGYLGVKKVRKEDGRYHYIYYVFEHPKEPSAEEEKILKKEIETLEKQKAQPQNVTAEPTRLAERLYKKILENKPNRRIEKKWRINWALDIEKLHRIDKRDYKHIEEILDWSQNNDFWRSNILSGKKLRDKFERLEDDRERERNKERTRSEQLKKWEEERKPKVFDLNKVKVEDPEPEPELPSEPSKVVRAPFMPKRETPEQVRRRLWGR